jgi:hypothetical protein
MHKSSFARKVCPPSLKVDVQVFYENKVSTSVSFERLHQRDSETKRYDASKN